MSLETFPYDAAEFLTDDATISAYLNVSLEEDDSSYFIRALGAVARAKNQMSELATALGMPVGVLDGLLRDGKNLEMDAVLRIAHSLGIHLNAGFRIQSERQEVSVA